MNEYLTITLTGRPPVRIKTSEWTSVAEAREKMFQGQYEHDAGRIANWKLIVLRKVHATEDKVIVYGVYTYSTRWQGERDFEVRGGELMQTAETAGIVQAIQRVGRDLEERVGERAYAPDIFLRLVHECIADLPAEEV